jgi:uncharacterized protein YjbJ (UPF0337 family)
MGIEDKVTGRVKQAAGSLTGKEALRREGKEDERRAEIKREAAEEREAAAHHQEAAESKAEEAERLERGDRPDTAGRETAGRDPGVDPDARSRPERA